MKNLKGKEIIAQPYVGNSKHSQNELENLYAKDKESFMKIANSYYNSDKEYYSKIILPIIEENKIISGSLLNLNIMCPQCQEKGNVYTRRGELKAGVDGGKATAAFLTGGISLIATGLSRKANVTFAYCKNCKSQWQF